jgi:hypothetical protein
MKYHDDELLYASCEGTGYFFTEVLTEHIHARVKDICTSLGFTNYFVHGFQSRIETEHFLELDRRLS